MSTSAAPQARHPKGAPASAGGRWAPARSTARAVDALVPQPATDADREAALRSIEDSWLEEQRAQAIDRFEEAIAAGEIEEPDPDRWSPEDLVPFGEGGRPF